MATQVRRLLLRLTPKRPFFLFHPSYTRDAGYFATNQLPNDRLHAFIHLFSKLSYWLLLFNRRALTHLSPRRAVKMEWMVVTKLTLLKSLPAICRRRAVPACHRTLTWALEATCPPICLWILSRLWLTKAMCSAIRLMALACLRSQECLLALIINHEQYRQKTLGK